MIKVRKRGGTFFTCYSFVERVSLREIEHEEKKNEQNLIFGPFVMNSTAPFLIPHEEPFKILSKVGPPSHGVHMQPSFIYIYMDYNIRVLSNLVMAHF